jgi:Thiol:disulfide interchange protein DsbD, N-terminal
VRQIVVALVCSTLLGFAVLNAQDLRPRKAPSVTLVNPGITSVARGKAASVDLFFHVSPGFHVNSNKPHSEFLIPTTLRLTAPTDIMIGAINYPAGIEKSFPFAPDDKMSVYGSQFVINFAVRPLANVVPGKYAVHGALKYQACDDATCYPPKQIPVSFLVKVVRSKTESHRRNPAQSPHVHR